MDADLTTLEPALVHALSRSEPDKDATDRQNAEYYTDPEDKVR